MGMLNFLWVFRCSLIRSKNHYASLLEFESLLSNTPVIINAMNPRKYSKIIVPKLTPKSLCAFGVITNAANPAKIMIIHAHQMRGSLLVSLWSLLGLSIFMPKFYQNWVMIRTNVGTGNPSLNIKIV